MGTTGGGATIAFTGKAQVAAGKLVSLSGISISGVSVEDADLSSSVNKQIVGDLITHSPVTATFVYASGVWDDDASTGLDVYDEAAVTIVLPADEDSAATTITCTCFISEMTSPELQNNQRMTMSITFQPVDEWSFS